MSTGCFKTLLTMFCRCPHCNKQRQVSAKELRDSRGLLKCKRCGQSFDALASLSEKAVGKQIKAKRYSGLSLERTENKWSPRFWGFASLLMFVGLLVQIVYFDGSYLYGKPSVHNALAAACRALHCELPLVSQPEEWVVSHSELQPQLDR